jgi:hypothetical protein
MIPLLSVSAMVRISVSMASNSATLCAYLPVSSATASSRVRFRCMRIIVRSDASGQCAGLSRCRKPAMWFALAYHARSARRTPPAF